MLLENDQDRNFFINIKTIRTGRSKRFLFSGKTPKDFWKTLKDFHCFKPRMTHNLFAIICMHIK